MKRKKLGLALSSGGARGIAHIGFLKVLTDNGVPIDCISGSSMGAVVGSIYCAGTACEVMADRAKILKLRDLLDIELFFFKKMGFIKGNKRENLIKEFLGEKEFPDCIIPFNCTAVDIMTGERLILDSGSLCKAVMASSAIPSIFAPVEIDGRKLVDGGVLTRLPIEAVRNLGADVVVAVDVLGDTITSMQPKSVFSTLIRTINIMDWEITKYSMHRADLVVTVEQPEVDQFMAKNLDKSIEAGERAAQNALPTIKKLLNIE
jgi:NTE family protein